MQGSDFIWLASIIAGITLLGWLVLDWLESAQKWDTYDADPNTTGVHTSSTLGRSEHYTPDPVDVELELMLNYPLDPFAPALMWRPQPQDQWIEAQEATGESAVDAANDEGLEYRPSESA